MADDFSKYTGSGLALRKLYNDYSRSTRYNDGLERLDQSIALILTTRIGASLSNPEFGSRLHEVIFDGNTFILNDIIDMYVREALIKWEPRILVDSVFVDFSVLNSTTYLDTLSLPVYVGYTIKKSNQQNTAVVKIPIASS